MLLAWPGVVGGTWSRSNRQEPTIELEYLRDVEWQSELLQGSPVAKGVAVKGGVRVARWRRIAAGVGLALCGLLLTGCRAEGTFDILSEERVLVDLMLSGPDVDCSDGAYGPPLSNTAVTDASGLPACHIFGESSAAELNQFGISISTAAEYLVLQTNLSLGSSDLPAIDIQFRFPGEVVTATEGTVIGNAVRVTDLAPLAQGSGMRVIALGRPAPPAWMMAAAIGTGSVVVGMLLILGLVWLGRRRRHPVTELIALEPAEVPDTIEESSVAADPNGQVAVSSLPPPGADPPAVADEPPDNVWFEAPTARDGRCARHPRRRILARAGCR